MSPLSLSGTDTKMGLHLNWKELSKAVEIWRPEILNKRVERVVVPQRSVYPETFLKSEWLIRLKGKKSNEDCHISFSVRSNLPYFALGRGRGTKAAQSATHSGFDLFLNKELKGSKVIDLIHFERERVVALQFARSNETTFLFLCLIPSRPEALLTRPANEGSHPIISRTRSKDSSAHFKVPDGSRSPDTFDIRSEFFVTPFEYKDRVETEIYAQGMELRKKKIRQFLQNQIKQFKKQTKKLLTTIQQAEKEPNWAHFGDLLKVNLGTAHSAQYDDKGNPFRTVFDYEKNQEVRIPSDPKLTPQQQVEKFYRLSKRNRARLEESSQRLEELNLRIKQSDEALGELSCEIPLRKVIEIETKWNLNSKTPNEKKARQWAGRTFISSDHLTIYTGRSQKENTELTFRIAKGNDIWLHLKGRPSAHSLISSPRGKSVPLATLLDAAALTIYYSLGRVSEKVDVDYTPAKYVKKVKGSQKVTYSQNKTITLSMKDEEARLARLLRK